jgi:hypothetical protein
VSKAGKHHLELAPGGCPPCPGPASNEVTSTADLHDRLLHEYGHRPGSVFTVAFLALLALVLAAVLMQP